VKAIAAGYVPQVHESAGIRYYSGEEEGEEENHGLHG
jgi:hypothetical protein